MGGRKEMAATFEVTTWLPASFIVNAVQATHPSLQCFFPYLTPPSSDHAVKYHNDVGD